MGIVGGWRRREKVKTILFSVALARKPTEDKPVTASLRNQIQKEGLVVLLHLQPFSFGKAAAAIALALLCGALQPSPSLASEVAPPTLDAHLDLDPMVAGRLDEARAAVLDAPQEPGPWLDFGKVLHAHELTEPAAECYTRAVALAPADPRARYFLALAQYDLGEPARDGSG